MDQPQQPVVAFIEDNADTARLVKTLVELDGKVLVQTFSDMAGFNATVEDRSYAAVLMDMSEVLLARDKDEGDFNKLLDALRVKNTPIVFISEEVSDTKVGITGQLGIELQYKPRGREEWTNLVDSLLAKKKKLLEAASASSKRGLEGEPH